MRYALLALALIACSHPPDTPPLPGDRQPMPPEAHLENFAPARADVLCPSEIGCEWGCPAPLFPILFVDEIPEVDAGSTDTSHADIASSVDCDRKYDFRNCCGDRVCQDGESAFFCPVDCL